MQEMQGVVIVFVGILSVVRATPFDLYSVDQPTPFQHTFRVEKVDFGNDALKGDSEHEDDNEIRILESDDHSKFIDEPDEGRSMQGITDLFSHVQSCELLDLRKPPKEGCAYVANGNIYFIRVLSTIDIEDVYVAFGDAGIEECEVGEYGLKDEPKDGCFTITKDYESVFWIGVYDEDVFYEADEADDIKDAFDNKEKCDLTSDIAPLHGCVLFDQDGIHFIFILITLQVEDFERIVNKLDISECIFDEEHGLINKDRCYWVNRDLLSIHFLNLHGRSKGVQDNDDVDDSKETYGIPDVEVSPPSVVKTETGNGNLQQLKLKGHFNQRSSVAKKAKVLLSKKIQSRKQP